jgi:cytochrome c oxidase subunit III
LEIGLEIQARRKATAKLGIILFLISESFLFGALFWTYFYLKGGTPVWPPQGIHLGLVIPGINTFFLLSSSMTIWFALRAIRKGSRKGLTLGLTITTLLGAVFLGLTIFDWLNLGFRPWTNAYGSIYFTLTGFHALHVLLGVILLGALLIRNLRKGFSRDDLLPVDLGSYYWHFVDIVWILVFTSIFILR